MSGRAGRRAARRRETALRIALVAALVTGLAGAGTAATAVLVTAAGAGEDGTDGSGPGEAGVIGEAAAGSAASPGSGSAPDDAVTDDVSPRGIVLLADPGWVVRVSEASGIPTRALSAYAGAALSARADDGCAVGWNTLAGIGLVESAHGTLGGGAIGSDGVARPDIVGIALDGTRTAAIPDTDGGALDGDAVWDRALGPMQFLPETWEQWGSDGEEDGVADVHDIDDAALTAARYLCHAHGTLDGSDAWIGAIRSYNDDPDYQRRVAAAAAEYASFG